MVPKQRVSASKTTKKSTAEKETPKGTKTSHSKSRDEFSVTSVLGTLSGEGDSAPEFGTDDFMEPDESLISQQDEELDDAALTLQAHLAAEPGEDPVRLYLREIGLVKLLGADSEFRLACCWRKPSRFMRAGSLIHPPICVPTSTTVSGGAITCGITLRGMPTVFTSICISCHSVMPNGYWNTCAFIKGSRRCALYLATCPRKRSCVPKWMQPASVPKTLSRHWSARTCAWW
ncbi:MAG: hypothetical protein IPJ47_04975 [Anaerolineales bacterium]|nr:hypothetical protein [Anaerolineales bacterium]